jgi:CPA2 family monovalent cation:H+ antiporter-2
MPNTLLLVLILLATGVVVAAMFRRFDLPPMLGYVLAGILIGPHVLGFIPESRETRHLAEFGVVFLMFSIGLEFSLPKLRAMRETVFGLGGAQVALSMLLVVVAVLPMGMHWSVGVALGGALAMSSTAIVSKMLVERVELNSLHGRSTIGVLLFQDLAVVPLLILIPALRGSESLGQELLWAAAKIAVVLVLLLYLGQRLLRPWFHWVVSSRSAELFMLNVLLITLGLAWLTELAGLSLALGAFVAGMLISETEYRYQVEGDIKPFRDVLLGLFFFTVGMSLDPDLVIQYFPWVIAVLTGLVLGKFALVTLIGGAFGLALGTAMRTGIGLAQGGEFGLVLVGLALEHGVIDAQVHQIVLTAMILSMFLAPLLIQHGERIVRLLHRGEWAIRAKDIHEIAVRSLNAKGHAIICGYGRSGQALARFLEVEGIPYVALDADLHRVRAAAAAGENVVFGDASRSEVLTAAGLSRARAVIVTFSDVGAAMKILRTAQERRPDLPVLVRTVDDADLDRLKSAGAAEVVPEVLEGSLMLAFQTLLLLGVPASKVLKSVRAAREARYDILRGFFRGVTDVDEQSAEVSQPRLATILVESGSKGVGKTLADAGLEELGVEVVAIRRRGIRALDPEADTVLAGGDVLVLRGDTEALAAGEIRLLQG